MVCRVAARWLTGPNIWSRRSTSFTGRPASFAASTPSACGPGSIPFDPKPPPRKGLRMWMFSGGMPNRPAIRSRDMIRLWVGMSIERLSPSHAATIECGSIAL